MQGLQVRELIAELEQSYGEVRMSLVPRNELLAVLTDAALAFSPGRALPTLGELCVSLGETQHCYARSFRTFSIDFEFRHADRTIVHDIGRIRAWHRELDAELDAALTGLSEADAERTISRDGTRIPLATHLLVFHEALLIFYGKAFVYLKAGRLKMPNKWGAWIE